MLTFKGESHRICEWSKILGLSQRVIWARLNMGWSVEKTLSTPVASKLSDPVWITFRGETLRLCEWSKMMNLFPSVIRSRLARGWTMDDVMTKPLTHKVATMLTWRGQTKTMSAWAKELAPLSKAAIRYRIESGWSVERTLSQPLHHKSKSVFR